MEHLTVDEIIDFVSFDKINPETLAFASKVNTHMRACNECMQRVRAFQNFYDEFEKIGCKNVFNSTMRDMMQSDDVLEHTADNTDNCFLDAD